MNRADRSRSPGCVSAPGKRLYKVNKCLLKNEAKINKVEPGTRKGVAFRRLVL